MRTLNRPFRKNQLGFNLVELSVVLAIVAVVVVGSLIGTRTILLNNSVNNQLKDTGQMLTKASRALQKQSNTSGVTVNALAGMGAWPSERMTLSAGNWSVRGVISGTSELVFPNSAASGSVPINQGLVWVLRNVPVAACADLILGLDSMAQAIHASPAAASDPTTGAIPSGTVVKTAGTASVTFANVGTGCTATSGFVDLTVVFEI